jgi:hypothetical protein
MNGDPQTEFTQTTSLPVSVEDDPRGTCLERGRAQGSAVGAARAGFSRTRRIAAALTHTICDPELRRCGRSRTRQLARRLRLPLTASIEVES